MQSTLKFARIGPLRRQSYLFALLLLVLAVAVNYQYQPNFFQLRVLSGSLRTYLPLMILAAGDHDDGLAGGQDQQRQVGAQVAAQRAQPKEVGLLA